MKAKSDQSGPFLSGAILGQVWSASESGRSFDRWLADTINTANTTVYDKAIDSVYLDTGIGGSSLHHLVDGQHDLWGAFSAAREALPNDSIGHELLGTAQHLAKDLFSVSGLPVVSINAETYRESSHWIRDQLGIPLRWQSDFMQVNAMELLSGTIGAVGLALGLKSKDVRLLGEVASTSGFVGVVAANPICLCVGVLALGFGIRYRESGSIQLSKGAVEGAASVGTIWLVNTALAPILGAGMAPAVFTLALSLTAAIMVRRFLRSSVLLDDARQSDPSDWEVWEDSFEQRLDQARKQIDPDAARMLAVVLQRSR